MFVGAYCWFSSWEGEGGAQIDLLLDRADDIINIVEVKWSADGKEYVMTKEDEEKPFEQKEPASGRDRNEEGDTFHPCYCQRISL